MLPYWWADDVWVVQRATGQRGRLCRTGKGAWMIQLPATGEDDATYVAEPDPEQWEPEVRQLLTPFQLDRITHDSERALLRAFGCHYVPEFEGLPERLRVTSPHPQAVGRPELHGLQNIVRGAVAAALLPYTRL